MSKKLYVAGGGHSGYANWILPLGFTFTKTIEGADLFLAEGGADWHYSWYNCKNPHHTTHGYRQHDEYEMQYFRKAIELNIPICGICRGGQIMPALVDNKRGKIAQHQNSHGFIHPMKTYDGKEILVSSMHHQAAWPYELVEGKEYKLLGWTEGLIHTRYLDADTQDLEKPEVEAAVFPTIKGLHLQMHPEVQYGDRQYKESIRWYQDTLIKFLNGEFND